MLPSGGLSAYACRPNPGFPAKMRSPMKTRNDFPAGGGLLRWLGVALLLAAAAVIAAERPTAENARTRVDVLRAEIRHHDELYYKKSAPVITDAAYDQLKRELAALERDLPSPDREASPSDSLGDDRSGAFPVYRHREPMQSLQKAYTEAELKAFSARLAQQLGRADPAYVVEPKFDGLAISVTYEQGKLVRAVTRGNGLEGDDVTTNALTIAGLPQVLLERDAASGATNPIPDLVELRGEVYLPSAEFARINREREAAGEPPFAHPRNLAAGTLKSTDPRAVAERGLAVVFYGWGACAPTSARPKSQREFLAQAKAWGLPGPEKFSFARGAAEIWAAVQALDRVRPQLAYPIDGAVVKLDAAALREEVGATGHAPRWAVAYKFAAERAEARLLAIAVQIGRTGVLTPVAEFSPVRLGGATITRATLHNRDEIARLDLRVGDFVYVEKAGEIIPSIVGVNRARRTETSRPYVFPEACPECGTAVVRVAGEVAVRCPNDDCAARLRRRLQHFASAACVDINGLGPAVIDGLVAGGLVKTIPDLYRLRREQLLTVNGVGGKTADRLLAAIDRSKQAELWRFIHGLGLPQVGGVAAKTLARRFGGLDALAAATAEELSSVLGVTTGAAVAEYLQNPKNRTRLADLLAAGVRPGVPAAGAALLTGKTFVLTGTLPGLTRAQAEARIVGAGGKVAGSVSRNTHFVVAGEGSGEKQDTARALGIPVIDEAALLAMLLEN